MSVCFPSCYKHKRKQTGYLFAILILLLFRSPHIAQSQNNLSIIALVDKEPITTADIAIYRIEKGNSITKKEALKALIVRKLLLSCAHKSGFTDIQSLDPATFRQVVDKELAKIDLTHASTANIQEVRKMIVQKVKEVLQIHFFLESITTKRTITYNQVRLFYFKEAHENRLPKVEHQVVLEQIIYIPKNKNFEKEISSIQKNICDPLRSQKISFEQAEKILTNHKPYQRYYRTHKGDYVWAAKNIPPTIIQHFAKPITEWKEGDTSQPHLVRLTSGQKAIRIFYVKKVRQPHVANLEDYEIILNLSLEDKKAQMANAWIKNKVETLVTIYDDAYANLFRDGQYLHTLFET
ncbi:MAG: hypothetical protein AAF770_00570 [Bacteroidota bacterium]